MLVVELLVVALLVVDGVRGGAGQFSRSSLAVLAALAVVGVLHTEIALRVERARRRVTPSPHIDLSSVWTFAAALLLPPLLAAAVVAVVYLHLLARVWRPTRQPVYRWAFTTCTVVLAVHAASAASSYVRGEAPPRSAPAPAWPPSSSRCCPTRRSTRASSSA